MLKNAAACFDAQFALPADPATVLVVEDSTIFRRMLGHYANKHGQRFLEAASLEDLDLLGDAVAQAQVAWVDVHLGDACCGEAIQRIRKANPDVAVVLMSAIDETELLAIARKVNAEFFACKPLPFDIYTVIMHNAMQVYRKKQMHSVGLTYQAEVARMLEDFFDSNVDGRRAFPRKAFLSAAMTLRQALRIKSATVVRLAGGGRAECLYSTGIPGARVGASASDDGHWFRMAVSEGGAMAYPDGLSRTGNSLLAAIAGDSIFVVPGAAAARAGDELIWVVSRDGDAPLEPSTNKVIQIVIQLATMAMSTFERVNAALADATMVSSLPALPGGIGRLSAN